MRALFVFLKKMDFKDPRGINTRDRKNERTKPTQGSYLKAPLVELFEMDFVKQLDILVERRGGKFKGYKTIKEYILNFNLLVLNKLKKPTIDFIKANLINNNIFLTPKDEHFINKKINDLYFYSYIFYNKKNRPKEINYVIQQLQKIDISKVLDSYSNVITLTEDEVNSIGTVVLNTKGKQVSILVGDDIRKPILARWESVSDVVEVLVGLSDHSESQVRQNISELILDLKTEAQHQFNITPMLLKDVFETLIPYAKNKQRVYSFMHSTLEPFFPSLHNEEEYWAQRDHSVREKRRFTQHQRDSIDSLMQVKT